MIASINLIRPLCPRQGFQRTPCQEYQQGRQQIVSQENRKNGSVVTGEVKGDPGKKRAETQAAFVEGIENATDGAIGTPAKLARE